MFLKPAITLIQAIEMIFFNNSIDFIISGPQGVFIALHVWEIVGRQNFTIFKGCHYSQFYITISLTFRKIETKNLNPDSRILIFLLLGTNYQLQISYLNIRSDHDREGATREYSHVPLKTFVKLPQDINIFIQGATTHIEIARRN